MLTNLVGSLEGQLFSNSVWNFVLDPDLAMQEEAASSSSGDAADSSSRSMSSSKAAELPYHRRVPWRVSITLMTLYISVIHYHNLTKHHYCLTNTPIGV